MSEPKYEFLVCDVYDEGDMKLVLPAGLFSYFVDKLSDSYYQEGPLIEIRLQTVHSGTVPDLPPITKEQIERSPDLDMFVIDMIKAWHDNQAGL